MCRTVPGMVRGQANLRARAVPDGEVRFRKALDQLVPRLRHMRSTVAVAVAALRRQNCELDEDIASLLQRCVSDRIDDELEKLEGTLRVAVRRGSERGRATGRPWRRGRRPGHRRRALAS